jgi:hypothetical protein
MYSPSFGRVSRYRNSSQVTSARPATAVPSFVRLSTIFENSSPVSKAVMVIIATPRALTRYWLVIPMSLKVVAKYSYSHFSDSRSSTRKMTNELNANRMSLPQFLDSQVIVFPSDSSREQ